MNIVYKQGNLLDDDADWLVNPVNCVGVRGAGLAAQFKRRWPAYFDKYHSSCWYGGMHVGEVSIHHMPDDPQREIVSFPTKKNFIDPSQLKWIREGLMDLANFLIAHKDREVPSVDKDPDRCWVQHCHSIAFPKLGCGLGGLNWADVHPLLVAFAEVCSFVEVRIYGEPL